MTENQYIDPRTGHIFKPPIPKSVRPQTDRKRQIGILFGQLVNAPVYKELKSLAQSLSVSPYPADLNSMIAWLAAQGRKSGFDLFFDNIERIARSEPREEQPPQDGMRGSYFLDDNPFTDL